MGGDLRRQRFGSSAPLWRMVVDWDEAEELEGEEGEDEPTSLRQRAFRLLTRWLPIKT